MPRTARIVIPGMPHHITHRGNYGDDVFFAEKDYLLYSALIKKYARKFSLDIWAYCLMTNHIHFVAVPQKPDSIASTMQHTHQTYALSVNRRSGQTGHLWQGRYYSCALDDAHLWAAVRYIESNPVRAGMVEKAEQYPWSSAAAHCGIRRGDLITGSADFPPGGIVTDWSGWLLQDNEYADKEIRKNTLDGYPCGSAEFIEQIEKSLGKTIKKPEIKEKETT